MSAADRTCCDGLCQQGQPCPVLHYRRRKACTAPLRLAPGVIDGPYKPVHELPRPLASLLARAARMVQP